MGNAKSRIVLALLFTCSGSLLAQALRAQEAKWTCTETLEYLRGSRFAHVALTQPADMPGVGEVYITLANVRRFAVVRSQGLEIRWDWNDPDSDNDAGYRYSFIIEPSGEGRYLDFDFGEEDDAGGVSAKARQRYTCRRTQTPAEAQ